MQLIFDPEVQAVAEFMQERIPANRLANVASGLAKIAPLIWGHYQAEDVKTIRLLAEPILACDPHTQSSSKE